MDSQPEPNATRFMFWNIRKKPIGQLVAAASHQYSLDLILLAECKDSEPILLELNQSTQRPFVHQRNVAGRVDVFSRFELGSLEILADHGPISFMRLKHPIGTDVLLAPVHLQSKLHMEEREQSLNCTRIIKKVKRFERKLGHKRTVIVGDFNINPFETGLVAAECFHASISRRIAERGKRVVQGTEYSFFYNPMWSHFGDRATGPPGTYFHKASSSTNIFWHMFDQVLIRPELLGRFEDKSVQIITKINTTDLANEKGRPIVSDHFPIVFALNLLEG